MVADFVCFWEFMKHLQWRKKNGSVGIVGAGWGLGVGDCGWLLRNKKLIPTPARVRVGCATADATKFIASKNFIADAIVRDRKPCHAS